MRRNVAFIADSLDNAYRFHQVLSGFDAQIAAGSTLQLSKLLDQSAHYDLIVFEARGNARAHIAEVVQFADSTSSPLLAIVDETDAATLMLPQSAPADFLIHGAGEAECEARVHRLLLARDESPKTDEIAIENMVMNLATYQVSVAGVPIDLTYLEYALLSFLVQHPNHTFSRDALLQHVWGFDYYGGSRTVDVHVRRIRAKLGPELAQRLETVRGVGYLWSM